MSTEERAAWQRWHEQREASVQGVPGNLALIGYQPLTGEDAPVELLAGPAAATTVRRSARGARFVFAEGVAEVDGVPVSGETEVDLLRPDGTPVVRVGGLAIDVFSLDGGDAELRVYDPESPALARFKGIDTYPYDPRWVLPAVWTPTPDVTPVAWDFSRSSDTGHAKRVPGVLALDVAGQRVGLTAFLDGEALVVVFADGTTGDESYQPGRFLRIERPERSETVVDFNRAFVPPCGFSDWYSCPLPPPENRIAAPVRAGERRVR